MPISRSMSHHARRASLAALAAALLLGAGGCAETDRGLEARDDAQQIDDEVTRRTEQLNRGVQEQVEP